MFLLLVSLYLTQFPVKLLQVMFRSSFYSLSPTTPLPNFSQHKKARKSGGWVTIYSFKLSLNIPLNPLPVVHKLQPPPHSRYNYQPHFAPSSMYPCVCLFTHHLSFRYYTLLPLLYKMSTPLPPPQLPPHVLPYNNREINNH